MKPESLFVRGVEEDVLFLGYILSDQQEQIFLDED